jgi:hypothetical protein
VHSLFVIIRACRSSKTLIVIHKFKFFLWDFSGCGLNYHKRCVYKIPNNCSHTNYNSKRRRSSTSFLSVPRSPSESGSLISISGLSDDSSTSPSTFGGLVSLYVQAFDSVNDYSNVVGYNPQAGLNQSPNTIARF